MEMKYKGFFLTIDGLLALTILVLVLALIASQTFQPATPRGVYLKQISLDTLTVLDNSGRISLALSGNTTAVREVFEALPIRVCMQLNLENTLNVSTIAIAKPGCKGYGSQLQTTYKTITVSNTRYIARLESWYDT